MPELPEVETIVRSLQKKLIGLQIADVKIFLKKSILGSAKIFKKKLLGRRVTQIERRGKNIIIHLDNNLAMVVHLRMTGSLRFWPVKAPLEKHTHLIFSFREHPGHLHFCDQRQFGRIYLEKENKQGKLNSLQELGPEPLQIDEENFIALIKGKRRLLKPLLLDQSFISGVGNIYADEALHWAGVHPRQRTEFLSTRKIKKLFFCLQALLQEAIRQRGTSVRTYVDANGSSGGYQKFLQVYGREGEKCKRCRTVIIREKIGGRSTFYCPRCQPLKGP